MLPRGFTVLLLLTTLARPLPAADYPRYPARAATDVPLGHWAYALVDRLAAWGWVQSQMAGLRPWTRLEFARLTVEAGERLGESHTPPSTQAQLFYAALAREFAAEMAEAGRREIRVEEVYARALGIQGPPLRDGYHFGQTIINDHGRPFGEGTNLMAGLALRASAGPVAAYARGEYQRAPASPALPLLAREAIAWEDGTPLAPALPAPSVNRRRPLQAYFAVNLSNFQLSFGRQALWWGPARGGSLLFSDNAEPISMLRITRTLPLKLPSLFSWMGPLRGEFFLGQLAGHELVFGPAGLVGQFGRALDPQPYVHGQKISFKPTPNLELGFSRTTLFSGAGAPFTAASFWRSLVPGQNYAPESGRDPGDSRSGLDLSYRLPGLRQRATFYVDAFTEDELSPVAYWDRSAILAGLYLPQLPWLPRVDLRVEGVYTDLPIGGNVRPGYFYANSHYRNGYTSGKNLLGSWIGRGSQGVQAWSGWHWGPQSWVELGYRHQKASQQFVPGGGTISDAAASLEHRLRPDLSLSATLQYERWRFPVLAAGRRSNCSSSVQLTFWPGRWAWTGGAGE
jgi:hypothetical protein